MSVSLLSTIICWVCFQQHLLYHQLVQLEIESSYQGIQVQCNFKLTYLIFHRVNLQIVPEVSPTPISQYNFNYCACYFLERHDIVLSDIVTNFLNLMALIFFLPFNSTWQHTCVFWQWETWVVEWLFCQDFHSRRFIFCSFTLHSSSCRSTYRYRIYTTRCLCKAVYP